MKKMCLLLLLLVFGRRLIVAAEFYIFYDISEGGLYNHTLREYYCTHPHTCKHEEGHKQDHALGWFSATPEFDAITKSLVDCRVPGMSQLPIIRYVLGNDDTNRELYANLYRSIDLGEFNSMPELLDNYAKQCENVNLNSLTFFPILQ